MSHEVKYTMGHSQQCLKATALGNPIHSDSYWILHLFDKKGIAETVPPYPLSLSQPGIGI